MRRKVLFWKLYPSYLLICLTGVMLALILAHLSFKKFYYSETSDRLQEKANLVKKDIAQYLENNQHEKLRAYVSNITKLANDRVTVILPSGKVIADSLQFFESMESHSDRPEIQSALTGEIGKSSRYSETLASRHLYLAVPIKVRENIIGVLRHSVSVITLESTLYNFLESFIFLVAILMIVLSLIIAWHSKLISRPLEKMISHAERLSLGDFSEMISISNDEPFEIYKLAKSLNKMSSQIEKQLEKIIKQKSELDVIFSSMKEGIITVDNDGNLFHVNQGALTILDNHNRSIDYSSLKGRPLEELVRVPKISEIINETLSGENEIETEIELNDKKLLDIRSSILQTPDESKVGAIVVFNDITRLRELEEHRKQFVENVSHELRTPLTSIRGFVETLLDTDIDEKEIYKKFLTIIKDQSIRLNTIVEDLLRISDLEKEESIELTNSNLANVVNSSVNMCSIKAKEKNVTLKVSCDELYVDHNKSLLEQAITNLIENAIKYGPANETVEIFLYKKDSMAVISVKDNGPGIDSYHHSRLFERFYSVDKARSRDLGGSGLGLSIVKHIVNLHNGSVNVESEPSKGSKFFIFLPIS